MGGVIGRLFREFALTVTAAIAVSVFVSLTLIPIFAAPCSSGGAWQAGADQSRHRRLLRMRWLGGYRRTWTWRYVSNCRCC